MLNPISRRNKDKLILFIHGLSGSADTWENGRGIHFGELLGQCAEISSEYDIAEFNYDSKIRYSTKIATTFRFLFGDKDRAVKKPIDINDVSEILKSELSVLYPDYKQIVIIAHSMGGLVSKSYVLKCLEEGIFHRIPLIISLAVPHRGSDWATYGKHFSNSKQVFDLRPLSEFLDDIDERWEANDKDNLPDLICVYGMHDSVVQRNSAAPKALKNKIKDFPCDEDHTSISKPSGLQDVVFQFVKKRLTEHSKEIKLKNELLVKKLEDPSIYDKEDFVLKLIIADIHESKINNAKELYYNTEIVNRTYRDTDEDYAALIDIYTKINDAYMTLYSDFELGKIKCSHELLNEVYKMIMKEHATMFDTKLAHITIYHKKGIIHHLANKSEYSIWWSLGHNQTDIERLRG